MLCHDIDILGPTEHSGCPTMLAQGRTWYIISPSSEARYGNELALYRYLTSRRRLQSTLDEYMDQGETVRGFQEEEEIKMMFLMGAESGADA